jgi:RNA polymerase sigma-70 factor (ECF subfamily)
MDDADRLKQLKTRAPGAVEALIEEFASPLLAAARSWGLPLADAEETVQDALVDFLAAIDRFEGRSTLKTFLFGVLYNKCSERRRKSRREEATEDVEAAFDARFGLLGIWNSMLRRCAEGLSVDQRAAFHLKVVERQDTAEVCKILGVTPTNLGVLLFRGRNKLRECLEKKWIKK